MASHLPMQVPMALFPLVHLVPGKNVPGFAVSLHVSSFSRPANGIVLAVFLASQPLVSHWLCANVAIKFVPTQVTLAPRFLLGVLQSASMMHVFHAGWQDEIESPPVLLFSVANVNNPSMASQKGVVNYVGNPRGHILI